jgi:anti-sigma regulatory factor (Ser/Thr protein kinase)
LRARFPAVSPSVPKVRTALIDALGDEVPTTVLNDAVLIGSELASNVIRHAGLDPTASFDVSATLAAGVLRLEVIDGGRGFSPPPERPSMDDAEGGRGLLLIELLSQNWGILAGPVFGVWVNMHV